MDTEAISMAVEAAGSQASLAKSINVTIGAVNQWVHGLRPVPAGRCLAIEKATRGIVTRYDLRPDVFGDQAA